MLILPLYTFSIAQMSAGHSFHMAVGSYGRRRGYKWRYKPELAPAWTGPHSGLNRAFLDVRWRARRTIEALRADIMHIHFGTRGGAANSRPVIPFVMHWHGTDIRTTYYSENGRAGLQWGADHAATVVFSTPDLREHAVRARKDAVYLPNPVDLEELPHWNVDGPQRIAFASRWDQSKGGDEQLRLAAALRRAAGPAVELVGLDWGDRAAEARALGISLTPRMSKNQYLLWMSRAHCIVGQSTGVFGMSELQALAMGIPLVMNVAGGLYSDPPVLQGATVDEVTAGVLQVLGDPIRAAEVLRGRPWIERHHSPDIVVPQLASIYRRIMSVN